MSEEQVHLGKEMAVASISCFGEDGTYPVLAAPTCKRETVNDMVYVFPGDNQRME